MNKIYKLLFLFLVVISGCKFNNIDNKIDTQSIDSFKMNFYSKEGTKILSIKSPISSYDRDNNVFNLVDTTISLFNNNIKEYIISSKKAKFSNNTFIELNGNVNAITLLQEDDKLFSNKFLWDIKTSEYLLSGNVFFQNKSITLSSNKAILNKDNNVIKFFKPVRYVIKDGNNENSYEIYSENAYYNINTKSLKFGSGEERVRSKLYF